MPVFIADPIAKFYDNQFTTIAFSEMPKIGYVGHAKAGFIKFLRTVYIYLNYNSKVFFKQIVSDYSPLYFSFVTNYTNKVSNYPQAAFFFNFKVKRFRASFAIDELQNFVLKNNMNYNLYPAQNYTFRFGFHWAFIN